MDSRSSIFRLCAVVIVVVFAITVGTPTKADADVLAAIGLATLAVAAVIVIAYLIVANASEKKFSEDGLLTRLAIVVPVQVPLQAPVQADEAP
jgi:hypothetical protein